MRRKAEHARTMAILQALVDPKEKQSIDRFVEEYHHAAFPFVEGGLRREKIDAKKHLDHFLKQGPLVIRK